jgi:hypothetical protein
MCPGRFRDVPVTLPGQIHLPEEFPDIIPEQHTPMHGIEEVLEHVIRDRDSVGHGSDSFVGYDSPFTVQASAGYPVGHLHESWLIPVGGEKIMQPAAGHEEFECPGEP